LGRILALDYGTKRTGVAVTDALQITVNSLGTVATKDVWSFLETYFAKEVVDCVVIGYPLQMSGKGSDSLRVINPFIQGFIKKYPNIRIVQEDERFTSKIAQQAILAGGVKKKDRQDKALVDTVSAAIILQSYLDRLRLTNR